MQKCSQGVKQSPPVRVSWDWPLFSGHYWGKMQTAAHFLRIIMHCCWWSCNELNNLKHPPIPSYNYQMFWQVNSERGQIDIRDYWHASCRNVLRCSLKQVYILLHGHAEYEHECHPETTQSSALRPGVPVTRANGCRNPETPSCRVAPRSWHVEGPPQSEACPGRQGEILG